MKWTRQGPSNLPSPFDDGYRWKILTFDLNFEVTKSPKSPVTLYVKSLNQLVVFQLPRPRKVGRIRKETVVWSTDMAIIQAFITPSTKYSFRCAYRRKWAFEETVDRAILEYTFLLGEGKQAERSGPHQIVIPLVKKKAEPTKD